MSSNNPERKKKKKSRSCFRVGGGEKKEKVFKTFTPFFSSRLFRGKGRETHTSQERAIS
jgi:hypothetical protein